MKIVGTVSYWEGGGTYQISDLKYNAFASNQSNNIQVIEKGHDVVYNLITPEQFCDGKVELVLVDEEGEEVLTEFSYAQLALNTAVEMRDLRVDDAYMTKTDASYGEITLTCTVGGKKIQVRTEALYDEDGNLITEEYYEGHTIDVKGLVGYYNGNYQIKVISLNDVVIK